MHQTREAVTTSARRLRRRVGAVLYLAGTGLVLVALAAGVLVLAVSAINGVARWNAKRIANEANSPEAMVEKAKDNIVLIGVDDQDRAIGFLAVKVDGEQEQIYGIAVPDGAFIEVPGQGFQRIGDSFEGGADVSAAAITNFFTVPFTRYAVIPESSYQNTLTAQSLAGVLDGASQTNLTDEEAERFGAAFAAIPSGNVALVPLPVKPVNVGEQTYFEPQREEIADLLDTWWGVTLSEAEEFTRVIIYNGSGVPGIGGVAAQDLIRSGFRVVDTRNADNFDYETTRVVVQNGPVEAADEIVEVLGVGEITEQPADQQVADIIIIIGKDYEGSPDADE
jgi:hypothetical protein